VKKKRLSERARQFWIELQRLAKICDCKIKLALNTIRASAVDVGHDPIALFLAFPAGYDLTASGN
jgi:hypothetical protein